MVPLNFLKFYVVPLLIFLVRSVPKLFKIVHPTPVLYWRLYWVVYTVFLFIFNCNTVLWWKRKRCEISKWVFSQKKLFARWRMKICHVTASVYVLKIPNIWWIRKTCEILVRVFFSRWRIKIRHVIASFSVSFILNFFWTRNNVQKFLRVEYSSIHISRVFRFHNI